MIRNIFSGLILVLMMSQCSETKKPEQNSEEKKGATTFAGGIELVDLNGESIDLSEHKGKAIILNIWATWCKPCIEEFPSMQTLQSELDPSEYVMLFASSEDLERIKKFKDKNEFDLNFIRLLTSPESLGIYSLPITFIISREGELLLTQNGSKHWGSTESIEEIKKLVK
jgi:thiol-disulfide isomerase/thioredoxin